jgi:gliding motility associated protien GldN
MTYYIKEAVYYGLRNASFRTRVLAVCPVLVENDEFSDGPVKYPLFWVEYSDLEPYLSEVNVIPDYRNRASVMSLADYFELGMYKGVIYKVDNAFGHTLLQGADSDSVVNAERQRIELELRSVRRPVFNIYHHN